MDLTKALDFLEKQGLDDCHYQDSGMMEHIAENMQKYADQQLFLSGVSQQRELLQKIEKVKSFKWGIDYQDNENRMCQLINLL